MYFYGWLQKFGFVFPYGFIYLFILYLVCLFAVILRLIEFTWVKMLLRDHLIPAVLAHFLLDIIQFLLESHIPPLDIS